VEKNLSLDFDETSALLEMSVCSYGKPEERASTSAITKLARLYHDFQDDNKSSRKSVRIEELPRAA
jgi:hypothetical protein